MRHGTTAWAEHGRFAGWGDAALSADGEALAKKAGFLLRQQELAFDVCHTSRLTRAQSTLEIVLAALGRPDLPIVRDWRLNERHYGALQEHSRMAMAQRYGQEAVIAWRRSYRARPPVLEDDDPRWLEQRRRFPDLPETVMPRAESLEEGALRVEPYWQDCLAPALRSGQRVLLVAHTCSIRGLVRIIDRLSDDDAEAFRIPTALPVVYDLDDDLTPVHSHQLINDAATWWRNLQSRLKPRWWFWG
jgi:2,3-bisphosphoglycerate-dependent phosphoglycerate mutase